MPGVRVNLSQVPVRQHWARAVNVLFCTHPHCHKAINTCGEAIYFTFLSLRLLLCESETIVISVSWPDVLWLKSLHLALHSFIPQICINSKVLQKFGIMNHLWSFCFLDQALRRVLGVMMKLNVAQSLFLRKFSVKWMRRTGMRLYEGKWHIRV